MTYRAAIYARVSTGEQTTENQLRSLRDLAARSGWVIVQEYVETASGANRHRAQLTRMMSDAEKQMFDVVAAWDVSRLGRSLSGLVNIFETLRELGVDLYLQQQALDTSTPAGKAMLQMSGVFAEFERSMIVERTKAGMERARSLGKRIGRPPTREETISQIRSLRSQGMAMDRIARTLHCGKGVSQRVCKQFDSEILAEVE